MNPKVSFVVPCYKLAHLLGECVESILSQTFTDFEVLIMDDCSPDNTGEVAASFHDPRVRYIRNEPNLGHLRNYNKGIELSRGEYVRLISADDKLRVPYVLSRYVDLMDSHPNVGYAFCPGMRTKDGIDVEVLDYSVHGKRDCIVNGRALLKKLVWSNTIIAASGMVRRECYERVSVFPLDMPWAGDWYLWCIFALHFDVGYFAEPMVCYRTHQLSMTNILMHQNLVSCSREDVNMPWIVRHKAIEAGYFELSRHCLAAAAREYALSIGSMRYRTSESRMTLDEFETSLDGNLSNEKEKRWIRARVYRDIADLRYWSGEPKAARQLYWAALRRDPFMMKSWAKLAAALLGSTGLRLRKQINAVRRQLASARSA